MNLLIYIELHPIRNSLIEFSEVAKKFVRMLDAHEQITGDKRNVKIFCNPDIYSILVKSGIKAETLACLIKPHYNEWQDTLKYFGDWNAKDIERWKKLIKGVGHITRYYEKILRNLVRQHDFHQIVTWGHNGAVKNICMELNLKHTVMELGPFREPISNSIQVEILNVNGDYVSYNPRNLPSGLSSSNYLIERYKSFRKPFSLNIKWFEHKIRSSKKRTVLIPLQLMDDANIVINSKYKSMEHFLNDVLPYLNKYRVFVKPHPYFKRRQINLNDHNHCKKLVKKFNNVLWLGQFKSSRYNPSLIGLFDKIIGINSSLLFEGVVLDKKVYYLGDSNMLGSQAPVADLKRKCGNHYKIAKNRSQKEVLIFEETIIFEYKNFLSLMSTSI